MTILLALLLVILAFKPSLAYHVPYAIEYDVLALLASLMMVSKGLELSGFFEVSALKIIALSRRHGLQLLLLFSGLASSIIMNDAGIFVFTPLALAYARIIGLDPAYYIILTSIAVNIGSSLTPIGNPQNIIIWRRWSKSFIDFTLSIAPFTATSMTLLIVYSIIIARLKKLDTYPKSLRVFPHILLNRRLLYTSATLLVLDVVLAHYGFTWLGLLLTATVFLVVQRSIVLGLDYTLLLVFTLLFIDFKLIPAIMPYKILLEAKTSTLIVSALLSQAISNVPATLLLIEYTRHMLPLLVGVNIGGVGLPIGSLANIITLRLHSISTWKFTKTSIPYFLTLLAVFTTTAILLGYP